MTATVRWTLWIRGVQEVARQNPQKPHYAATEICRLVGFEQRFSAPFFNEFVVRTPRAASEVLKRLFEKKIIGGIALDTYYQDMSDSLLVCVTENAKKECIEIHVCVIDKL